MIESWTSTGKRIDAAGTKTPEPIAEPPRDYRETKRASEKRAREQRVVQTASAYEAEMNQRILTELAAIQAGWSEDEHIRRRIGRTPEMSVPRAYSGVGRRNGVDISR